MSTTKYIVNNQSEQTIGGNLTIDGDVVITGTTNTRPYKVYTALLTQSGGNSPQSLGSGAVTKGVTYRIKETTTGDFSNVGAPNNNVNTIFVATNNEIPNSYGGGNLSYNTGAPVVTVLENTIGNIWFEYTQYAPVDFYSVVSDNLFEDNKTTPFGGGYSNYAGSPSWVYYDINNTSFSYPIITIKTSAPGTLLNTPIEIRVYN